MLHLAAVPVAFRPLTLAVQAGGGGSFSGGHGGGGDGSSGGGRLLIEGLYWLIRLSFEHPTIGVPLDVVLVLVGVVGLQRGWWRVQERTIRKSGTRRVAHASSVGVAKLRARDPRFDAARLLARVHRAFRLAQDAWCAQDLEPLRPFVSDGVFERFALQIEEQRADGWRQGMDDLRIEAPSIAHVQCGPTFESITVSIRFRADIHRVDLASGERVRGSRLPRDAFSEYWSFVRRRGTLTLEGEGLIEGKCPSCAAPLSVRRSARCEHCGALVRSGRFDWVLCEITQASEWRSQEERSLPGLAAYLARDPGMNAQMLEDRASVAFWRKCAAERALSADPLQRIADDALCARLAAEFARRGLPSRPFPVDCAVGSVRTLGVLAGAERDRAVVEVTWDARGGSRDATRVITRTLFVFARPTGQTTSLDEAFTTAHCRTCGAPDLGGTDAACPYCGAARRGAASEWLLAELWPAVSAEALGVRLELEAEAGAPSGGTSLQLRSPSELVAWAVSVAQADGVLDPREERAIRALAERAHVPAERFEAWLAAPKGAALLLGPRDESEARTWIRELARVALSDGHLAAHEARLLERVAARAGLTRHVFRSLLVDARGALYRESRAAARAADAGSAA